MPSPKQLLPCLHCGRETMRDPRQRFCSRSCAATHQHGNRCPPKPCEVCGTMFKPPNAVTPHRYCSVACAAQAKRTLNAGERNPNWKHGRRATYSSAFQKRLGPMLIQERGRCELCGEDGTRAKLEVHHKDGNKRNDALENLQVLCVHCHRDIHREARRQGVLRRVQQHPEEYRLKAQRMREAKAAKAARRGGSAMSTI